MSVPDDKVYIDQAIDLFENKPLAIGVEGRRDVMVHPEPGYESHKVYNLHAPCYKEMMMDPRICVDMISYIDNQAGNINPEK